MPRGVKQRHILHSLVDDAPTAMGGESLLLKQVVWKQMVMLKVSRPALLVAPDGGAAAS